MKTQNGQEDIWGRFFGQSSFARFTVVAESSVVNIRDFLRSEDELRIFAPLGCGFQTGMGAVENIAVAGPNDTILIVGMGAVGLGALMVCFNMSEDGGPFYLTSLTDWGLDCKDSWVQSNHRRR